MNCRPGDKAIVDRYSQTTSHYAEGMEAHDIAPARVLEPAA